MQPAKRQRVAKLSKKKSVASASGSKRSEEDPPLTPGSAKKSSLDDLQKAFDESVRVLERLEGEDGDQGQDVLNFDAMIPVTGE